MRNSFDNVIEIVQVPQVPAFGNGKFKADPNLYNLYNADGGSPLGQIKRNYALLQPQTVIDKVTQCLEQINGIDLSKLQYDVMRGGAKHRLVIPVYEFDIKNERKINDVTVVYLQATWGYDGRTKHQLSLFGRRLWCLNGCTFPMKAATIEFKNYSNNIDRLQFACNQFVDVIEKAAQVKDMTKAYDKLILPFAEKASVVSKVMNTDAKATAKLLKGIALDDAESKSISAPKQQTLLSLKEAIEIEIGRTGETAWGLLNGFTYFTNHMEPNKTVNTTSKIDDRIDYLLNGGGSDINNKAFAAIDELVRTM